MKLLYHGSQYIIKKPRFGVGNKHNDYGLAFYCTEDIELAKEWACTEEKSGYVNSYLLQAEDLTELNLCDGTYHILNWLAILLENRIFRVNSELKSLAKDYILNNFMPDYKKYDIIRGYRADDSNFSFANAFLNNQISLQQLEKAMVLGDLGQQVAVRSQKAFGCLNFTDVEIAESNIYFPRKMLRDETARGAYRNERALSLSGTYILDILRQKWGNDDERLQRNLFG